MSLAESIQSMHMQGPSIIDINALDIDELPKEIAWKLRSGRDIFLTGAGGTGKTYNTRQILKAFKNPIILGTTALAAQALRGETIHSFFNFRIAKDIEELKNQDKANIQRVSRKFGMPPGRAEQVIFGRMDNALRLADLIVIDEISMASGDLLDMILYRLKRLGELKRPPILAVGDLLQLAPVKARNLVFESPDWDFETVELERIYRTDDPDFMVIQNKIRLGICDRAVLDFMEERRGMPAVDGKSVILVATNKEVDGYNRRALANNDNPEERHPAVITKHRKNVFDDAIDSYIERGLPIDKEIKLKIGARVIITNNVYDEERDLLYYNGQKGTYRGPTSSGKGLLVETDDKGLVEVNRFEYDMVENGAEDGKVTHKPVATIKQFPLRLAYAMTIHKAQGMTLDQVHVNARRIFAEGQFYVAISRATSAEGLRMAFFNPGCIKTVEKCLGFYQKQWTEAAP